MTYKFFIFDDIRFWSYGNPNLVCKIPPKAIQFWVSSKIDFFACLKLLCTLSHLCPQMHDEKTNRLHYIDCFNFHFPW